MVGKYLEHSLNKPYGYAGDFEIIDMIYQNAPRSLGFARLYDNYFQMSTISIAVRNRKEDFKAIILDQLKKNRDKKLRILDLASGPCRDISEVVGFGNRVQLNFGKPHVFTLAVLVSDKE